MSLADDLHVPLTSRLFERVLQSAGEAKDLDWLFYVGSMESFDLRGRRIATAFARILQAAGVKFAILGAREGSTGECVRRSGNEMTVPVSAFPHR